MLKQMKLVNNFQQQIIGSSLAMTIALIFWIFPDCERNLHRSCPSDKISESD
ncbi:MAG: hypothetical protein QNJ54_13100 [Prochloraceae cyanobacterium]|nr:hypothetical protein [Prochloraceae cyanobacterium]